MVTREILKNEIDKIPETKWELLLQMMHSLESSSCKNDQFIIFVNSGWHKVVQEAKTEEETEEIHSLYFILVPIENARFLKRNYLWIKSLRPALPGAFYPIGYKFIQSLKLSQGKTEHTEIKAPSDWHEFVNKFFGICKDDPINRGDQGELEERRELE